MKDLRQSSSLFFRALLFGVLSFFSLKKMEISENCFAKISVTKFWKLKIRDCYLLRLSMLFIVVYSVFSVDAFVMEKIAKQNCLFWLFWKKGEKGRFCFVIFSMKNASTEKNRVHHNKEHCVATKIKSMGSKEEKGLAATFFCGLVLFWVTIEKPSYNPAIVSQSNWSGRLFRPLLWLVKARGRSTYAALGPVTGILH